MKRRCLLGVLVMVICIGGCSKDKKDEKISDIDFTVCDDSKVPKEFLDEINRKKTDDFFATFSDGDYMYVAKGYGKQPTGGYSIVVEELYNTEKDVVLDTGLIGPGQKDLVLREATYPYIVVKMEYTQKDVVYDK